MTGEPLRHDKIGAPGRSADLDLFKTLLVWGMIAAHCIQLLAFRPKPVAGTISDIVNLITFSGFMFAFGLGVGLSRGRAKGWGARLRPAALLLLATWTSSIAFMVLVERATLTPELLWSILSLSRLYGWSEFLASFFTLYLIIAIARPLLVAIGSRWYLLVPISIACLAGTQLVVSSDIPLLATLVGTRNFASFPLIPYLPWFLVGIFHARNPQHPNAVDWLLAFGATALLALHTAYYDGAYPERFPPSALWVLGSALPLLALRWLSRMSVNRPEIHGLTLAPGRHVLAALLVSNLAIFTIRHVAGYRLGHWWWTPILAFALIAAVTIWAAALDKIASRSKALPEHADQQGLSGTAFPVRTGDP